MNSALPTAAQWPEISRLLDDVLALRPDERPAWLDRLATLNPVHHDALRGLLDTLGRVEEDHFLDELPRLDVDATPPSEALTAGKWVGPWRLVREIGVGGMGTVWLAERSDGGVHRRVALKLPRTVWGGSFAERLARESSILAALEHDHIARLHDAGLDAQGRPFLALEYVEGQPIDVYCRDHALPLRERVGLLLQTMDAVAHAHARLVVHRDLKPANILVTNDGRVKLLDFGIAKLLESDLTQDTALTQLAGRALTPEYASPEQIRGEPLGTASDVYSLGVIAYELLAEAKPYRLPRGSAAELEEAIAHAQPTLASAATARPDLRKALRGDLDAILNRALKKRVDERYPSVEAFSQDLQRAMAGKPVHARPDSRAYRVTRFVRRNRLAVGFGFALGLSVLGGGGVATWQAVIARRAAEHAEFEVNRQAAVHDLYAESMMALSVTATEHPEAFTRPHVITQALQDKLHEMAPRYTTRPFERAAQLHSVMLQLNYNSEFEASLAVGKEYLAHLKANQGAVTDVVSVYTVMGRNLARLKRWDECEAVRRAGLAWKPDVDKDDEATQLTRLQLASDLGNFLTYRGKRPEARKVLEAAQAIAERQRPAHASRYENGFFVASYWAVFDEFRQMQAAQAAHDGMELVKTLDADQQGNYRKYYGVALLDNGRNAEAEAALQSSRVLYTEAYGKTSLNAVQGAGLVALAIARRGDYERANRVLAEQLRLLTTARDGLDPTLAARLLERQLEVDWLAGDVAALRVHLPSGDAMTGPPGGVRGNITLLLSEARALALLGRGDQAATVMTFLRSNWPDPVLATAECLRIQAGLASAQLAAGQPEAARATARGILASMEHEQATAGRPFISAHEIDALASARLGDTREAALALAAADRAQPAPPFTSDVARSESLLRHAETLKAIGRAADAAQAGRDALALLKTQRADSPRLALALALANG